jgi:transposase
MGKAYPSDLTRDQFELIAAKLPADSPRGRPRITSYWAILNAIFHVLGEGCTWRRLPGDFPPWQTGYTYFRRWSDSPSELIIDSQSMKTANYVHQAVGYDGAKHIKGRKRHTVVDTLGLVLRVWVSAANVAESKGAKTVLQQVKAMGQTVQRVITVWADGGYGGEPLYRWVIDVLGWVLWVTLRPRLYPGPSTLEGGAYFWLVESLSALE